jgi:alginate O-acetyltransferase complex protein AlgJ
MKASKLSRRSVGQALVAMSLGVVGVQARAQEPPVVIGKDEWLFTRYEYADQSDAADTQATIQLMIQANKAFEQKGIAVALVIVPSKIRVHQDKLPADKPLDAYTSGKYVAAVKALREGGVHVISLNEAFLASQDRTSDTPLYFRLDTHWAPKGALLAAETIGAAINQDAVLAKAFSATAAQKYTFAWSANKMATRSRDLVRQLPTKDAMAFPPEQVLPFKVVKDGAKAGLLGPGEDIKILAIGSSYTNKNTGYPDALRYVLQRNLLDISLNVDFGPWYGMLSYLKDDAYKTNPPRLIIWEVPERELRSPPNYKYRHPEYIMDNNAWLEQLRALLS